METVVRGLAIIGGLTLACSGGLVLIVAVSTGMDALRQYRLQVTFVRSLRKAIDLAPPLHLPPARARRTYADDTDELIDKLADEGRALLPHDDDGGGP